MCCKPSRKANSDGIQTHPSYFTRCSLVTRKIWHTSLLTLIHFIPEHVYCIGIKINSLYCFNFVQEKNIILSKKKILKCVSVQCESYIKVKANLHLYSMYYMYIFWHYIKINTIVILLVLFILYYNHNLKFYLLAAAVPQWVIAFARQAEGWVFETGSDSSNAKRSALGVSVTGPRR